VYICRLFENTVSTAEIIFHIMRGQDDYKQRPVVACFSVISQNLHEKIRWYHKKQKASLVFRPNLYRLLSVYARRVNAVCVCVCICVHEHAFFSLSSVHCLRKWRVLAQFAVKDWSNMAREEACLYGWLYNFNQPRDNPETTML
jgi:hypothetical protein